MPSKGFAEIDMPSPLRHIGESAFEGCTRLTSVIFPAKLARIKSRTFKNCVKLRSVTLGPTTLVAPDAFTNCISLQTVIDGAGTIWPGPTSGERDH